MIWIFFKAGVEAGYGRTSLTQCRMRRAVTAEETVSGRHLRLVRAVLSSHRPFAATIAFPPLSTRIYSSNSSLRNFSSADGWAGTAKFRQRSIALRRSLMKARHGGQSSR